MAAVPFPPIESCDLCPRACGANRSAGERGACGAADELRVARSALHFWEEPPISGTHGSGTVFFSHCPLACVYCQNQVIASGEAGASVSIERLAQMFLELEAKGALNINLVTPTHYAPHIRAALDLVRRGEGLQRAGAKGEDGAAWAGTGTLALPVVWNTSGYETAKAIHDNRGYVDVYLTDFKYASPDLAARYSKAADYAQVALQALEAMVDEAGSPRFDANEGDERMTRGVVVRHLMLPGALEDSKRVVQLVHERFGDSVRLSLMSQYTPVLAQAAKQGSAFARRALARCPELAERVGNEEYEELLDFADAIGVQDYYWQEGGAAEESFIPAFDLEGVLG